MFIILYIIMGGGWILYGLLHKPRLTTMLGHPIGGDFVEFWAASALALQGTPDLIYQLSKLHDMEVAVIGVDFGCIPWLYPPSFLLLVLPLALLPYLAALVVWLTVTLLGALVVVRKIAPHPVTLRLALAFPGIFANFLQGQNGFLTMSFMGGGLLLVDRSPFVGGVLLGMISYKPHLAFVVLVALVAGRRWKALGGAAVAAGGLALLSGLVFGLDTWIAFWKNLPFATKQFELAAEHWHKMPTTYVALRLLGGGNLIAQIMQVIVTISAIVLVFWIWSRQTSLAIRASALVIGTLLVTPYAFDYDLAILALPVAWVGWEGYTQGWLRGEKYILLLAWLTPFIAPILAKLTTVQVAPIVLATFLILLTRWMVPLAPQVSV